MTVDPIVADADAARRVGETRGPLYDVLDRRLDIAAIVELADSAID